MFPVRLLSVAAIGTIAAILLTPAWGVTFLLIQFAAYAVFMTVVKEADRDAGQPGALRRLRAWTELLTIILTGHVAVFIWLAWRAEPNLILECLLLLVGNMVLGGLQAHLGWRGFLFATLPPSLVLCPMMWALSGRDPAVEICTVVFEIAVIAEAWRQQTSNRRAALARAERAVAAETLRQALEATEQERVRSDEANRAKSKFLAMISHEVRTPLNVVLGLASVLKPRLTDTDQTELVGEIESAGGMLLRLLNGVLDLSKIESGEATAKPAPVDLRQALQAITGVWRERVNELGLTLSVTFDGSPEHFCVFADGAKVEQTVINFISNALKLTPAGGIEIRASARPAEGGIALRIAVHDEGPGVPPEYREKVFEPFEQLAEGRAAGGAGLGLAICKANVHALGGRLGVDNKPDRGAIFWFEFEAPEVELVEAEPEARSDAPQHRLKVLAAEDHPGNRRLLSLLLDQLDADVVLAEDGAQAAAACAEARYDLVLMDVMMPVMDGVSALAAIRAAEPALGRRALIFMLTANVFDEDVASYMAAGADGVLRKPIELPELAGVLAGVRKGMFAAAAA
jgi:signal transduction histidine kinase